MSSRCLVLIAATSALAACNPTPTTPAANDSAADGTAKAAPSDPIESALRALPAGLGKDAAVVAPNPDGTMKMLRKGSNGFTCMADNPNTPGQDPMCMDANAMKWAEAWIGHKPPPANNVGLMYMLAGGSDASNTDPYGTKPADGKWVETGPHVMFGGTPYAHVMIPIQ